MTNRWTPASPASPSRRAVARHRWQTTLLLAAIVLLGAYFRTIGLYTWDDPSFRLHPDERFFSDVASLTRIPATFDDYLDSSDNTLNPRNRGKAFYVYGLLPQTITRFTAVMLTPNEALPQTVPITESATYKIPNPELQIPKLTPLIPLLNPQRHNLTDYYQVYRVGRSWSVFWDCGTIVLVFLLGRRLYGRRVGLLAALFYALSVLPIQLAHFFTVDAMTGFFTLLTIFLAVRLAQGGGWGNVAALGLSIGATMACRITLATLALLAFAALAARLLRGQGTGDRGQGTGDKETEDRGQRTTSEATFPRSPAHPFTRAPLRPLTATAMLVLIGALAFLTFRTLQPDAFVGSRSTTPEQRGGLASLAPLFHGLGFFDIRPEPRFVENIQNIGRQVSGADDSPPSEQWAGRTPYLFAWQNMVLWGLGLPLGLAAWAGWALAGWQLVRRRRLAHLLPWLWVAFYFAWQGGQFVMTMRYYALLYGLLAIFAAWLLVGRQKVEGKRQHGGIRLSFTLYLLPFTFAVVTALWAFAFTRIYTQPHSRVTASRWIYEHVPAGATLTSELWDDGLPLSLDGRSSSQYRGVQTAPYDEDEAEKYAGRVSQEGQPDSLLDHLDQADYVILSSNRVYDSATRMPARYPALTRYYHYLFSGEMGFKLVADIHSYPTLFGVEIPTPLYAEEAFSVYDHPRVLIFQKTPQYSRGLAERLITDGVAWGEVYKLPTIKAGKVPTALRLTDAQWPTFRAGGTWGALFAASFLNDVAPWLPWLLVLELIGLATFALLFALLPGLPDRGYTLAKTLGLLLVAYAAWLLGSWRWAAFAPATLWLCAAPLLAAGALAAWRCRAALRAFGRQRRAALLSAEALFLAAFFGFLIVRALNPDLWHPARGGEKPMDLAFLTAVLKSASFPPYDPWFAGGYINYYYFGFVFIGALVHLTGVAPTVAYNLAVPTIFALTALGSFGVAYNLLGVSGQRSAVSGQKAENGRRAAGDGNQEAGGRSPSPDPRPLTPDPRRERHAIATGLVAAAFVVLLGNLAQAVWFLPGTANVNDPGIPARCQQISSYAAQQACRGRDEWAFWDATRIVSAEIAQRTGEYDGTITEFPFFTFLYGDLHAHMLALPLALLALGLMVAIVKVKGEKQKANPDRRSFLPFAFYLLPLLALVVGALRATNTWDYPTYLGLGVLTCGLVAWDAWRQGAAGAAALLRWTLAAGALVLLSGLLFRPFTQSFATDYAGIDLWFGPGTGLVEFLKINGVWLFMITSALLVYLQNAQGTRHKAQAGRNTRAFGVYLLVVLLVIAVLAALRVAALVLLIPLVSAGIGLLAYLLTRPAQRRLITNHQSPITNHQLPITNYQLPITSLPTLLLTLWGVAALGIALLTELVTAKGDAGRMNTVFKFGMQSWTLLALVAAVALTYVWRAGDRRQATGDRRQATGDRAGGAEDQNAKRKTQNAKRTLAWVWRGAALLLVGAALVYPLTATPARLADRFDTSIAPTLDGAAYMRSAKAEWGENGKNFTLAQDADALAWMRANISGTPIVLEAQTDAYHWAGRVATYTGLPTLLGWPGHESQQRQVVQVEPVLQSRADLIRTLYRTRDGDAALRDLRLYGVEYVYVGQLERALYPAAGLAKFDALAKSGQIKTVYSAGATRIYAIPRGGEPPAVLTTSLAVVPPTLPPEKSLMLTQPVETLPAVNEYAWNRAADAQPVAVWLWLLAWYGLLALGLPLAALLFGRWRDGGWVWARLLGLLLLGYAVWLPVSARLWAYNLRGVLLGVLLVLALNAGVLALLGKRLEIKDQRSDAEAADEPISSRQSPVAHSLRLLWQHVVAHGRRILLTEALFGGTFAFMLVLRALNPDLWQPSWGGEKPFEFAFLNAILRSPVMPPYNPFYSDGVINYYYYGLFLVSLPIKIIGVAPAVGFNLAVATLFALMFSGAFALAAQLTGRVRYGLLGAAFVALAGNLAAAFQVGWGQGRTPVRAALAAGLGGFGARLGDWFIGPSRVIPNTINEFPYWSYLFADLHPHLIAMPITLLAIALTFTIYDLRFTIGRHSSYQRVIVSACHFASLALVLGALVVTNSWDFPTYALLLGGALLGAAWRGRRTFGALLLALVQAVAIVGGALLLYLPFFQSFQAQVQGIALVQSGTAVRDYALIYGLYLLILVPVVLGAGWRLLLRRADEPHVISSRAIGFIATARLSPGVRGGLPWLGAGALLLLVWASFAAPVLALKLWLGALLLVGALVLRERRIAPATWFALWLAVVAWAVSLGVEFINVKDHLAGGDWARMNTVFKFGLQAWVLLALAAAALLPLLLRGLRRIHIAAEGAGWALLTMGCAVALVYPLVGTPSRVAYRFPQATAPTLDGLAFMQRGIYDWNGQKISLHDDGDAIRWLNANITGTPIVAQSSMEFYRAYGVRVAANTGLPTIVSPLHENEQRPPDLVGARDDDVNTLYRTTDIAEALRLLSKYRVGYVYVGAIERAAYGAAGAAKFDDMTGAYLTLAYQNPGVKIYKVGENVRNFATSDPILVARPAPARPATKPAPAQAAQADAPTLETLEEQVADDPSAAGPAFSLAQEYRQRNRLDEAAAVLATAAAANPKDIALHQIWGDILRDAGRQDEAENAYRLAAQAGPTAGNYNKLGTELLKMGRTDKALAAFQQAIAAGNDDASPYFYLGQIYEQRGDTAQAAQSYAQYLSAAPAGPHRAEATAALARLK